MNLLVNNQLNALLNLTRPVLRYIIVNLEYVFPRVFSINARFCEIRFCISTVAKLGREQHREEVRIFVRI